MLRFGAEAGHQGEAFEFAKPSKHKRNGLDEGVGHTLDTLAPTPTPTPSQGYVLELSTCSTEGLKKNYRPAKLTFCLRRRR